MRLQIFIFCLLIFSLLTSSCNNKNIERQDVFVYELSNGHSILRNTFSVVKDKKIINSSKYEVYKDSINDSSYIYSYHLIGSDTIISMNDTFQVIDNKTYKNNITISKYHNTKNDSEDQISYIFYNPKVGLISTFNEHFFRLDYIEYNATKGLRVNFLNDMIDLFAKNDDINQLPTQK